MIRKVEGGGLLGLGSMFRGLTNASPIEMAVNDARRMARRRLEAGGVAGSAVSKPQRVEAKPKAGRVYRATDIDADEFAKAIEAKLREPGSPVPDGRDWSALLERKAGGRVAVSGYHILRAGDGRYDLGKRFMHRLVNDIRAQRVQRRVRAFGRWR
jgi:hypothetical protein